MSVYMYNRDDEQEILVYYPLYRVVAGFDSLMVILIGFVLFSVWHVKSSYVYRSTFFLGLYTFI
jgi:hypothetical protein